MSPCTCGCVTGGGPQLCRGVLCGGLGAGNGVWRALVTLTGLTGEIVSSGGVSDWRMDMMTLRMCEAADG